MRAEKGEEHWRAFLQYTISVAAADFGIWSQGLRVRWVDGVGENFTVAPLANPFFPGKVGIFLGPKLCSSILPGVERFEAEKN